MTDFEIISILIGIIGLVISAVMLGASIAKNKNRHDSGN